MTRALLCLFAVRCGEGWSRPYAADEIHPRRAPVEPDDPRDRTPAAPVPPRRYPLPASARAPLRDDPLAYALSSLSWLPDATKLGGRASEQAPVDLCTGLDQPAIVSLEATERGERVPVWVCERGCAPGFTYVTRVDFVAGRRSPGYVDFAPQCTQVCASGTHALSRIRTASVPATCVSGVDAFVVRDEERRVAQVADEWSRFVASANDRVAALERAPAPWDDEALERFSGAARDVAWLRGGVAEWFLHRYTDVARNYEDLGVSSDYPPAQRQRFAGFVRARLHEPRDQVGDLDRRLEALAPRAEARSRDNRERAAARDRAEQREREQAAKKTLRQECIARCQGSVDRCWSNCAALPAPACDACRITEDECRAGCVKEGAP